MSNSLLTINMITQKAVKLFRNTNAFIMNIDMQYDDSFARSGAKIGQTLRIRLPNDYTVTTGPGLSVQDTAEVNTTITVATQKHVDVSFSTVERTMSLDAYSERVLAPMVNNLAGAVAADIMSGVEGGVCNIVYNADASNNIISPSLATYTSSKASLKLNSAPMSRHKMVLDPITLGRTIGNLSGLLNPQSAISKQYESGEMYRAVGFDWFDDQTIIKHTTGTFSAGTINGSNQTGSIVTVNAITGTLIAGDIITLPGVNAVNRVTKTTIGTLRQFVVTANVAANATSIPIYPAIVPPVGGQPVQYQTVTASPTSGGNVLLVTNASSVYRKNIAYAPEAVTMVTADLELPGGVQEVARQSFDGLSMRMLTDYIPTTDQTVTRLDILYGYLFVRPEWAVIVGDAI